MTIKSALSVVALTVALTGASFAQGMMINGAAVPEAEVAAVQAHCDELKAAGEAPLASTTESTSGEEDGSADNTNETSGTENETPVAAAAGTIDLTTVDLQACMDGGFVTQ